MRSSDRQTIRELAHQLLVYEEVEVDPTMAGTHAVSRVCGKLRRPLSTLVGAAGFRSLLSRALTLAKQEASMLGAWEVSSVGSLQMHSGEGSQLGAVLIAHLLGLMVTLIGESLTLQILNDIWLDLPAYEAEFGRKRPYG